MAKPKPTPALAFGEVLRNLRSDRGLSQEALARAAGVDRTFVSLLERGLRQPTLGTMLDLAEALDTDLPSLASKVHARLR